MSFAFAENGAFDGFIDKAGGTWVCGVEGGKRDSVYANTYVKISDCIILKYIDRGHFEKDAGLLKGGAPKAYEEAHIANWLAALMVFDKSDKIFRNFAWQEGATPVDFSFYDASRKTLYTSADYDAVLELSKSEFSGDEIQKWAEKNALSVAEFSGGKTAMEFFGAKGKYRVYPFSYYLNNVLKGRGKVEFEKYSKNRISTEGVSQNGAETRILPEKLKFLGGAAIAEFQNKSKIKTAGFPIGGRGFCLVARPLGGAFFGGENIGWLAELFPSLSGDFFDAPKDYFYVSFSAAADCAHKFADGSLNFMGWLNIKKFSQGGGLNVETKTLRLVLRCKPGSGDVYIYAYPTMGIFDSLAASPDENCYLVRRDAWRNSEKKFPEGVDKYEQCEYFKEEVLAFKLEIKNGAAKAFAPKDGAWERIFTIRK